MSAPATATPGPQPGASLIDNLTGLAENVLDNVVGKAVVDPLDVRTADDVRAAVKAPTAAGATTFVLPALAGAARRWSGRVEKIGSRMSLTMKALLTAVPPLATSVTLGMREMHVLTSLVVHRMREEGLPVDRRFVQRVTVNAYVWPAGGRALEEPQAPAVARLAGLWATRPLAAERPGEWVGRAADAIERADLRERYARYGRTRPVLEA